MNSVLSSQLYGPSSSPPSQPPQQKRQYPTIETFTEEPKPGGRTPMRSSCRPRVMSAYSLKNLDSNHQRNNRENWDRGENLVVLDKGRNDIDSPPPPQAASYTAPMFRDAPPNLPNTIWDPVRKRMYKFGELLGKGGFAYCYEAVDLEDSVVYALKVIPKHRLTKPHHYDKVLREIRIHQRLDHKHVVKLLSSFEDDNNIYITLEYCRLKSLVSIMKKRGTLTEPEVRYYIRQLLMGVHYLCYTERILHRDIKLGNLLLSGSTMQVKLADFGLATEMDARGMPFVISVCGTPNYISPEVLRKQGHSIASEMWAIGCTIYAMLAGKPPFETNTLDDTYRAIANCRYTIPTHMSMDARDLIVRCLQAKPSLRPSPREALDHPFFSCGFTPMVLSEKFCSRCPSEMEIFGWSLQDKPIGGHTTPGEAALSQYLSPANYSNRESNQLQNRHREPKMSNNTARNYSSPSNRQTYYNNPYSSSQGIQQQDTATATAVWSYHSNREASLNYVTPI